VAERKRDLQGQRKQREPSAKSPIVTHATHLRTPHFAVCGKAGLITACVAASAICQPPRRRQRLPASLVASLLSVTQGFAAGRALGTIIFDL
jgi:hypothetical protein